MGVRGKTLYLSILQYAFLPSPNTEFFKTNNVVSLNMLVKHVFFEQINYQGCQDKQNALGIAEVTKAEIDHKNVRRYQRVNLSHLELFKESDLAQSKSSHASNADQMFDFGDGMEAKILQSIMGGGDDQNLDLENMMSMFR